MFRQSNRVSMFYSGYNVVICAGYKRCDVRLICWLNFLSDDISFEVFLCEVFSQPYYNPINIDWSCMYQTCILYCLLCFVGSLELVYFCRPWPHSLLDDSVVDEDKISMLELHYRKRPPWFNINPVVNMVCTNSVIQYLWVALEI